MKKYDLKDILPWIDPAALDYQQWVNVGMALKGEGYPASMWEDWSRRDPGRYHPGECVKKWGSFNGAMNPVTAGTVVQLARDQGWSPPDDPGHELDWNSVIGRDRDEAVIVDRNWIEDAEIPPPREWDPAREIIRYLEALFDAGENVGYVVKSYHKDDRYLPTKGNWDRTAGELIEQLSACGDIGEVLGDYDEMAGAWIRFNPLDGNGCKNENVSAFRHALIESDELPIEQQYAIIKQLELPVAVLVHSGKRSLHAIVRIDAANYDEYRKRVDYLYAVCQKNGLKIDSQNRNPSRLARMPGIMRAGQKQYIVAQNIGKDDWNEWREWIESVNDDLPDPANLADMWDNMPPVEPELIKGVLRQGHKMLIAGLSKAGKSYALIEMCIAIAEGVEWFGWQCAQGRVLYINLELAEASCWNRIKDVYKCMGIEPVNRRNIDVWNLRGRSLPMDKLAPKLIRRASKRGYIAIVIDPIYKVITGDENSADQMAKFCNQFDLLCTELGCAVIYCHHHSKGVQGQKRSMDRASGSGVFARDPDALLDMIQLEPTQALVKQEGDKAALRVCREWLKGSDKLEGISQDDLCSVSRTLEYCEGVYSPAAVQALKSAMEDEREGSEKRTAWRIEGTLREFERFEPVNLWFEHPVHRVDEVGSLRDIRPEGDAPPWKRGGKPGRPIIAEQVQERRDKLESAFSWLQQTPDTVVRIGKLSVQMGVTRNTAKNIIDAHEGFERDNDGIVRRVEPGTDAGDERVSNLSD
ncbi:MAG: AAA family ATPase [Clostridia bacterium]|nr:AAA family ATPase [Clostridia bacterium]